MNQYDITNIYESYKWQLETIIINKKKAKRLQIMISLLQSVLFLFIGFIICLTYFSSFLPDNSSIKLWRLSYQQNPLYVWVMFVAIAFISTILGQFFIKYQAKYTTAEHNTITNLIQELFRNISIRWYKAVPEKDIKTSKLFWFDTSNKEFYSYWSLSFEVDDIAISMDDLSANSSTWFDIRNPYIMMIPILSSIVLLYQYTIKTLLTKDVNNPNDTWKWSFCKIMFYKKSEEDVFVFDNTIEKLVSWYMSRVVGENVRLENNIFNQNFLTYSKSQFAARYILSPLMMEKIITFKQKYWRRISLSFVDGVMYVVINNDAWLLSFNQNTTIWVEQIQQFVTDIETIMGIVDTFNLTHYKEKYTSRN